MSASDITAIEQVLYRYCFAVDSGTAEEVAALFAEDAVLIPAYTGQPPAKGRPAILDWYVAYKKGTSAAVDHLRHVVSNPSIQVDGNTASAQCYLTSNSVSKATGMANWVSGLYRDKLVKRGGQWLLAEREIHVHYATESKPRG